MEKGKFIKQDAVADLDDDYMIGMHSRANEINKNAPRYEHYFIKRNNNYYIVKNPTKLQKLWADFKHNFYSDKRQNYSLTSLNANNVFFVEDTKKMRQIMIENLKKQKEKLEAQKDQEKIR